MYNTVHISRTCFIKFTNAFKFNEINAEAIFDKKLKTKLYIY